MATEPGIQPLFVPASASVPLNTWTMAALTYDDVEARLFVDGVMASRIARAGPLHGSTVRIFLGGGCDMCAAGPANGTLHDASRPCIPDCQQS
jgi:hypothetical protein